VPLAIRAERRLPGAPDLPTIAESVPGLVASSWLAVVAPNGTPGPIIAGRVKAWARRSKCPFARFMSPHEVTAFIHEQQMLWKPAASGSRRK
jgi:tripartite-type tricarboxylate transporter receptor subunit TctC